MEIHCRSSFEIFADALIELHNALMRHRAFDGSFRGRNFDVRQDRAEVFAFIENLILEEGALQAWLDRQAPFSLPLLPLYRKAAL